MDGKKTRKELISQYKRQKVTGGVYAIKNTQNGKLLFERTTDLRGRQNRYEFARKSGFCYNMKLQKDLTIFGSDAFVFEVLEAVDRKETQTDAEFAEDIELLKEMWLEKLSGEAFY